MSQTKIRLLFPALVAVLLSLPCLNFTFLWDDYHFLANELTGRLTDWLPQIEDPFYRPISRALYFAIVGPFGSHGALFAHLLNLGYLAATAALLTLLGTRLGSPTAGLITGVVFAGLEASPALVGWASCAQDLISVLFVLLALLLRYSGRNGWALTSTAAALLSKETAIAAVPALVAMDWFLARKPYRLLRHLALYGAVVLAWVATHPAVKILLSQGLQPGATGYVGLVGPADWVRHAGKYMLVIGNLRLGSFSPTWPGGTTFYLASVVAAATVGLWALLWRGAAHDEYSASVPHHRLILFGVALAVPPLLLTSTMIESWAPYYAAYPALGASLLAGLFLSRARASIRVAVLTVYLILGVWARGSSLDEEHVTERMLRPSSDALKQIEAGFRKVQPQFPPHADVVVSVQASGLARVYPQIYGYQVLRIWYRDPTLRVRKPELRRKHTGPEFLFAITPDKDVVRIDPVSFAVVSASGEIPDYAYCERALRGYAMGLAGLGETDQAAVIMLRMPKSDPGIQQVHMRMAAMFLLAGGRHLEADTILSAESPMPRGQALLNLPAILAEQPSQIVLDDLAMRVFGIQPNDPDAMRYLARWFAGRGYADPAQRFANRLLHLSPGDTVGVRAAAVADSLIERRKRFPLSPDEPL
jgi:hypothetical protein